jgi:hypothetical protein
MPRAPVLGVDMCRKCGFEVAPRAHPPESELSTGYPPRTMVLHRDPSVDFVRPAGLQDPRIRLLACHILGQSKILLIEVAAVASIGALIGCAEPRLPVGAMSGAAACA